MDETAICPPDQAADIGLNNAGRERSCATSALFKSLPPYRIVKLMHTSARSPCSAATRDIVHFHGGRRCDDHRYIANGVATLSKARDEDRRAAAPHGPPHDFHLHVTQVIMSARLPRTSAEACARRTRFPAGFQPRDGSRPTDKASR